MKKEKLQHCVNAIKAMAVEQLATTGDIYAMMHICAEKNDIDYFEDVKDIAALQQFLPAHLDNNFL